MASKNDPRPDCCVSCKRAVGDEPKIAPVYVSDAVDAEKRETWCPPCFAFKRAPMEPARFRGQFGPVACATCKWESLAHGVRRCPQCGGRFVLDAPPPGMKVA